MYPTLNIANFVFPTSGLVIILGAWLCLSLIEKSAKRLGLNVNATYTLAVVALFAGFVGARLTFVVQYWSAFQENLTSIIWPLTSGYNPVGGVIIGALAAFFYGRAKNLPFAATLDALTPGLILGLMVISLADFLGGPGYGTLTAVSWGVSQYGVRRHPVQIYEIIAGLLALSTWWLLLPRRHYVGQLFLSAITLYSAARLLLDAFRDNTWLLADGYHGWQVLSFIVMIAGLILLARNAQTLEPPT